MGYNYSLRWYYGMKKLFLLCFCFAYLSLLVFGQSTSVTNNNTVIIQGNVYYFQPSNTPSSPQPTVGGTNFISTGSWYGENAARAWASISDWAVERCISSSSAIRGSNNERVYISQVHAYRRGQPEIERFFSNAGDEKPVYAHEIGGVAIYYWIVRNNERMEDGRRAYRFFLF